MLSIAVVEHPYKHCSGSMSFPVSSVFWCENNLLVFYYTHLRIPSWGFYLATRKESLLFMGVLIIWQSRSNIQWIVSVEVTESSSLVFWDWVFFFKYIQSLKVHLLYIVPLQPFPLQFLWCCYQEWMTPRDLHSNETIEDVDWHYSFFFSKWHC